MSFVSKIVEGVLKLKKKTVKIEKETYTSFKCRNCQVKCMQHGCYTLGFLFK